MDCKNNITSCFLKSILDYNKDTGMFIWKYRESAKPEWNKRWAGKIAGNTRKDGYISIRINGVAYLAHRLAWLYVYGNFPIFMLDHINRITGDNRITNLRESNHPENSWNTGLCIRNTTGYKNISYDNKKNMYNVKFTVNKKFMWFGYYKTLKEAVAIRDKKIKELHGDFAVM